MQAWECGLENPSRLSAEGSCAKGGLGGNAVFGSCAAQHVRGVEYVSKHDGPFVRCQRGALLPLYKYVFRCFRSSSREVWCGIRVDGSMVGEVILCLCVLHVLLPLFFTHLVRLSVPPWVQPRGREWTETVAEWPD
ncbi:hypothetical protein BU23DRAFT_227171 [Bimuria novae-zelandiae CBS 107.79]|uniref:Uncharacterized protein n=1 Tax=Bimuria novae-zelandiae CBS 107.79 TaxID=1447943 RepID=A0A6A5VUI4_9PLEO|nr:hypothetical protein BU23DRAFT_227171 [Bimuria novae-zelandiae CBS 107.79]